MGDLLFLDKVLMQPERGGLGGVEMFNANLLRDLCGEGYRIHTPLHRSRLKTFSDHVAEVSFIPHTVPSLAGGILAAVLAAIGTLRCNVDTVLLGNVGNRLIPAIKILNLSGRIRHWVLIAHRRPSSAFLAALRCLPVKVDAVNSVIAADFRNAGFDDAECYYGITNGDTFFPAEEAKTDVGIDFVVLGDLSRAWKGADTAVNAFCAMPDELRQYCRLHLLAADLSKDELMAPGVVRHAPLPPSDVPGFLRKMDVMLVPSRDENGIMRETFSQAIVQGMLTGLPVICTKLPVLEEKLDEGGGIVAGSDKEVTAAMVQLAQNPHLRRQMGCAGRKTALQRYVWNSSAFAARFLPSG